MTLLFFFYQKINAPISEKNAVPRLIFDVNNTGEGRL
jgi:hypothetical protein